MTELVAYGHPMYGNAGLLRPGDAVATTREVSANRWELQTYVGTVTERPTRHAHGWTVVTDTITFDAPFTRTLAIWEGWDASLTDDPTEHSDSDHAREMRG